MAGVFLSYSRVDRAVAHQIINGLRALGVDVWWDEDMPGVDWQQELERQINSMSAVLVLWTAHSVGSNNVRDEARLGLDIGKLVNVMAGVAKPPFPYDRVNGLPLDGWSGREPHGGWSRLVQTIEEKIVRGGGAEAGRFTTALREREGLLRTKLQEVNAAQEAYQEAQTRERETTEAAAAAKADFERAEAQMQQVVAMRAASGILRGAQEEVEAARAARNLAEQPVRDAKAAFVETSRRLAGATAAIDRMVSETPEPPSRPPPPRNPDGAASPAKTEAPARSAAATPPPETTRLSLDPVEASPRPASAPASTPTSRSAPARPRRSAAPFVVAAIVIVAVIVVAAMITSKPKPQADSAADSAAAAAAAAPTVATAAPSTSDLEGSWAPQGLTCADAYKITIDNDALTLVAAGQTSKATISSTDGKGLFYINASDGFYLYSLVEGQLSIKGPDGSTLHMTRCAP
jgi:hypothetical protein